MASFNPKVFIRPDGLKRIANVHLISLLEPWRAYFSWRGLAFPTSADEEFPHGELAKILLTYDPEMPIELMNGLYYIDEAASNETLDDLLDRAREEGIAIASHGKSTRPMSRSKSTSPDPPCSRSGRSGPWRSTRPPSPTFRAGPVMDATCRTSPNRT
jgi:hypothetical protein